MEVFNLVNLARSEKDKRELASSAICTEPVWSVVYKSL